MSEIYTRPLPILTPVQIERFLSKLIIGSDDECWPWIGSKNEHGYGGVRINDQLFKVPRIAYYLHYGADPGPLHVCHHCDTPSCGNALHYFLGTIKDNSEDSVAKGRSKILYKSGEESQSRLHPELMPRGEDHYAAKLTIHDIIEMRNRASAGERSYILAKEFRVTQAHVCDIIHRRRWKHI
jgi:hypothetical protein